MTHLNLRNFLKRRQILLGAVGLGGAFTLGRDYEYGQQQAQLTAIAREQLNAQDNRSVLEAALDADAAKIYQGQKVINSLRLTPPTIPYDRNISKLLIYCSKLATQQYLTGKTLPNYDGNLRELAAYDRRLDGYTQIASFRGKEAKVSESVAVQLPLATQGDRLDESVNNLEDNLTDSIRQVVKITQEIPVYMGFVLQSADHSLIVFRGTQTTMEWINNLRANQVAFTDPLSGQYLGKIHDGFINNFLRIVDPVPLDLARQLDPTLPCYITGHSLGASLAILAGLYFAINIPAIAPQICIYSYASPRVGDPTFAEIHARHVPNHYRVVNLADTIPLLPPTKGLGTYVHCGQAWGFLDQGQDIMTNHVVDTYQGAVDKEVETDQPRSYPLSAV